MKNKQHNQIKTLFILSIDKKNLGIITKTGEKFNPYVKRLTLHNKDGLPSILNITHHIKHKSNGNTIYSDKNRVKTLHIKHRNLAKIN